MGGLDLINSMATSTYTQNVGFPIASTTDFASSTLHVFYGIIGAFFTYDASHIIAYGMIGLVLLVPLGAVAFYRGY